MNMPVNRYCMQMILWSVDQKYFRNQPWSWCPWSSWPCAPPWPVVWVTAPVAEIVVTPSI
jgi:hypothetical protein